MQGFEKWKEELSALKSIAKKTDLTISIKWGSEVYTYNSKNVLSVGGFKNYFALWFYNGVFLKDKYNVLVNAQEGKTKSLRQWRFKSIEDIDEEKILEYINEAIDIEKRGLRIKPNKIKPLDLPLILSVAMQNDASLRNAFQSISLGKQNEYINFLNEAKLDVTKLKRLDRIIPIIISGMGLNDKYK